VRDASTGAIAAGPEIQTRGFAEGEAAFERVRPRLVAALQEAQAAGPIDSYQLQQVIRRTVGSFVGSKLRRRPMIIPVVIDA
jgi:ribonuclease J